MRFQKLWRNHITRVLSRDGSIKSTYTSVAPFMENRRLTWGDRVCQPQERGRYLERMHTGARPLTSDETTRLLSAFGGQYRLRNRALVQAGLYTGLRIGSLLVLKIGDVWDGQRFRRRLRIARRNLKGKPAGLDMPLHPAARFAIGRWLATLRKAGAPIDSQSPLFGSREGGQSLSRRRAQEIVNEAARIAGLGFGVSTHSWRKTFAGRLYEATGHNLLVVSKALHHRQLSTSLQYLGWKLEEKAEAAILGL